MINNTQAHFCNSCLQIDLFCELQTRIYHQTIGTLNLLQIASGNKNNCRNHVGLTSGSFSIFSFFWSLLTWGRLALTVLTHLLIVWMSTKYDLKDRLVHMYLQVCTDILVRLRPTVVNVYILTPRVHFLSIFDEFGNNLASIVIRVYAYYHAVILGECVEHVKL